MFGNSRICRAALCVALVGIPSLMVVLWGIDSGSDAKSSPLQDALTGRNVDSGGDIGKAEFDAISLFRQVADQAASSIAQRRDAAKLLAGHPKGEPWILVLLMDRTAMHTAADFEGWYSSAKEVLPEGLLQRDRAVLAALIDSIGPTASLETQWALTTRLADKGVGKFGREERIGGVVAHLNLRTDPIQDHARATLVRIVGRDHVYDVGKWRKAILDRSEESETNRDQQ